MVPANSRVSILVPLAIGLVGGLLFSGRFAATAQQRPVAPAGSDGNAAGGDKAKGAVSIQDALLRPYRFKFAQPTTLTQVCADLKQTLGLPVVLDLAALERQDVDADATVQLELEGVRLKTGLKLLLDQAKLTYHVVAEDNLLIITDKEGSEDPLERIWTALSALHRDLHAVQDAIDEIVVFADGEEQGGPMVRKPTIIEEMPGPMNPPATKDDGARPKSDKPEMKPRDQSTPRTPKRSSPTHVPLEFRGRSL